MSIIIFASLSAPSEITFQGGSQSYKNDFSLTNCGRIRLWDSMVDKGHY